MDAACPRTCLKSQRLSRTRLMCCQPLGINPLPPSWWKGRNWKYLSQLRREKTVLGRSKTNSRHFPFLHFVIWEFSPISLLLGGTLLMRVADKVSEDSPLHQVPVPFLKWVLLLLLPDISPPWPLLSPHR